MRLERLFGMNGMTCVRIGYGTIAKLHESKLHAMGVRTAAVIEVDPGKRRLAEMSGHTVLRSCAEASSLAPTFWDVCASTSQHLPLIEAILTIDRGAKILVEKPVCSPAEIPRLLDVVRGSRGSVVVNENYCSSLVTELVREIAFDRIGLHPRRIVVEMTKNRVRDFERGRFMDQELRGLGYEGPHLVATVERLGEGFLPDRIGQATFEDAIIRRRGATQVLPGQGSATLQYVSRAGVEVELHTALNGAVKHVRPPYGSSGGRVIPCDDEKTRHRMMIVEGTGRSGEELSVVGFYDPIDGFGRSRGAVATLRRGVVVDVVQPIEDDTMGTHLRRAVQYFARQAPNPCDIARAARAVRLLWRFVDRSSRRVLQ
jgi:hypothetical protein